MRAPQGRQAAAARRRPAREQSPRWYEFTLALILLAAIAAFAHLAHLQRHAMGVGRDHRRLAIRHAHHHFCRGHGGARRDRARRVARLRAGTVIASAVPRQRMRPAAETPCGRRGGVPARLAGSSSSAYSLLSWRSCCCAGSAWRRPQQYGLFAQLIYPASLGVTLVLLFDKATRTWGVKAAAPSRSANGCLCDLLVFLLVLAFLNLRGTRQARGLRRQLLGSSQRGPVLSPRSGLLDRTAARSRFLVGYGYLVDPAGAAFDLAGNAGCRGLPRHGGPRCGRSSSWPVVFFVLEAVTLVASSGRTTDHCRRSRTRSSSLIYAHPADRRHEVSPCLRRRPVRRSCRSEPLPFTTRRAPLAVR